jgi:predicted ATP-grasp superfamily ATP-dependent carboligase
VALATDGGWKPPLPSLKSFTGMTQRIFVYEHCTGGGMLGGDALPSLLAEGQAMAAALAADFLACGVEVRLLRDYRLADFAALGCNVLKVATQDEQQQAFARLAAESDWTVVIAPELDGTLLAHCHAVITVGGRLLGPGCELVRLTSDKHATAEYLRAAGIPTPEGIELLPGQSLPADFGYPAVLKPLDGCGSLGVRRLDSPDARPATIETPSRLERYCPGLPASVSVLSGRGRRVALPPFYQRLRDDGRFTYLGGSYPLPPDAAWRAQRLAERTVAALSPFVGYLGIDLIFGDDAYGKDDFVIEINPRLTTSYIGLRAAARTNRAQAMLRIAQGEGADISFSDETLEFDSNGMVRIALPAIM